MQRFPVCHSCHRNHGAQDANLTPREVQIARLLPGGLLNKEIAAVLGITEGTCKVYLSVLFNKLGASNRAELSAWAVRHEAELAAAAAAKERENTEAAQRETLEAIHGHVCWCGERKASGHGVCRGCFFWLSRDVQQAMIEGRAGQVYAAAIAQLAARREARR